MQFTYHINSGDSSLVIEGELYKYLFKVRREKKDRFFFRNLEDKNLYEYGITSIDRRKAILNLISQKELEIEPKKYLHIGWCIIDPKSIEKVIASLNELGVAKITFFYCQYSQKKYKINKEKLTKLLINSSQQSGRSSIIKLDFLDSLDEFLIKNKNSYILNFSNNLLKNSINDIDTIVVGCEGGFSPSELKKVSQDKIVGIDSNLILRSETATMYVASL